MNSFILPIALAATAVFAAPAVSDVSGSKGFTVKQVPSGQKYLSGPVELMNTYQKYQSVGAVAPDTVVAAAKAAKQQGTVTASPTQFDDSYLCPVTAGNQTLNLDFDTGSSDLWVFSTLMPAAEVHGQEEYNPASSTTAKKLDGYTWNIEYGDGSGAKGVVYSDKVVVGGVTATSQAVEAATSVSSTFTSQSATDGLLGLAFSVLNTVKPKSQLTFFDNVASTLTSKLFTVDLKYHEPGSYDFGFINTTKYTGQLSYVPVNNTQGFWGFEAGSYSVGTAAASASTALGYSIADTGTTLLYIPAAAAKAYYAKVSGAKSSASEGGYVFKCSTKLPDFVVTIGSGTYTIPGEYLNYAPINSKGKQCFGGIQANSGLPFNIFGDIFLKSVFAVFDQTTSAPRLGFAEQS